MNSAAWVSGLAMILVLGLGCGSGPLNTGGGSAKAVTSGGSCEVCNAGCADGLVTTCLVITPPGCGAQSSVGFCPYGCTPNGPEVCNFYPVDGAVSSGCIASSATISRGALMGFSAPTATTSFPSTAPRVIIASSASAACAASTPQGGTPPDGNGAVLTLTVPAMSAGTFVIGASHAVSEPMVLKNDGGMPTLVPGESAAQLTVWKNGSVQLDGAYATDGSVTVNVGDPIGGLIGSYDLVFGFDSERGTFIAPACDACQGPFKAGGGP